MAPLLLTRCTCPLPLQAGLSSELQELVQEKECGQELLSLIRQGKEQQALTLLATSSKLAWSTEGSSGAYPLHAAIQKGQLELAKALLAINGERCHGAATACWLRCLHASQHLLGIAIAGHER